MPERQESGRMPNFFVYRAFDDFDGLLYVGMTSDLVKRFCYGHRTRSHWIWEVERITAEAFVDRREAARRERGAIFREQPRWNAQHSRSFHPVVAARAKVDWPVHSLNEHVALAQKLRRLTYPIQYGTAAPDMGTERIRSQGRIQ